MAKINYNIKCPKCGESTEWALYPHSSSMLNCPKCGWCFKIRFPEPVAEPVVDAKPDDVLLSEEEQPNYAVTVKRIEYATHIFYVNAASEKEAEEKAMDEANEFDFNEDGTPWTFDTDVVKVEPFPFESKKEGS